MNTHFQIFSPLICAIGLRDLWLKHTHSGHEGCQAGQRLPPAAPHPHQQSIAPGLLQDAAQPRQVLQHVPAGEHTDHTKSRNTGLSMHP